MTFEEMDEFIRMTAMFDTADTRSLPYCALGLTGEAGEMAELVKKSLRSGQPIDRVKAVLELGDVQWYVGRMAQALGVTPGKVVEVMAMKLERRNQRQAAGLPPKDHEGERIEASIILGIDL